MSRATRLMAGLILISIPTIEFGGLFLLGSHLHRHVLPGLSVLILGVGLLRKRA